VLQLGQREGVAVDGNQVRCKVHPDGAHVVETGTRRIKLATAEVLLI